MKHPRRTISFFLILTASVLTTFPMGILLGGIFYYLEAQAGRIKSFGKLMDPWDAAGEGAMWVGVASLVCGIFLGIGVGICLKIFSVVNGKEFEKLRWLWIGLFGFIFGSVTGVFFASFGPMALVMVVSGLALPFAVWVCESLIKASSE